MTYEEMMDEQWENVVNYFNINEGYDFIGIQSIVDDRKGYVWKTVRHTEEIYNYNYAIVSRDRYNRHRIIRDTTLYKAVYGE